MCTHTPLSWALHLQHNNLGSVLEDHGQVMAAIISFRKATKINPGLAIAHYNLGTYVTAGTASRTGVKAKRNTT